MMKRETLNREISSVMVNYLDVVFFKTLMLMGKTSALLLLFLVLLSYVSPKWDQHLVASIKGKFYILCEQYY